MRVGVALVCLLAGCAGDLTLPGSTQPVMLRMLSGNGQKAHPGTQLEEPLVVQVLDAEGEPVLGARVEFGLLGDPPGAEVDPSIVTTDDDGRAEAFVTLGAVRGEHLVLARVADAASPELTTRFRVIAVGGGAGGGGGQGDDDHEEDD
jgi:hypothetical protein